MKGLKCKLVKTMVANTVACIFVFLVVVFNAASITPFSVLAIKNKSIPLDCIQLIDSFYPDSKKRFIANHSELVFFQWVVLNIVFLHNRSLSSLYGWDFRGQKIHRLFLSINAIHTISERATNFGNVNILDLSVNRISSIDLRRTKIKMMLVLDHNDISAESFEANKILFPLTVSHLLLRHNPIGKLNGFEFPYGNELQLSYCNITSITNVVFNAENVYLDNNPIKIIQNVTFNGTKRLFLRDCNFTIRELVHRQSNVNFFGSHREVVVHMDSIFGPAYYYVTAISAGTEQKTWNCFC